MIMLKENVLKFRRIGLGNIIRKSRRHNDFGSCIRADKSKCAIGSGENKKKDCLHNKLLFAQSKHFAQNIYIHCRSVEVVEV